MQRLLCRVFQVGNELVSFFLLFQASEDHFGARDVLLRVRQVDVQCVLAPRDTCKPKFMCQIKMAATVSLKDNMSFVRTFVLVRICVRESFSLAGLTAEDAIKVRASLVLATCFDGVALRTPLDKNLLSSFNVTHDDCLRNNGECECYKLTFLATDPRTTSATCAVHIAKHVQKLKDTV